MKLDLNRVLDCEGETKVVTVDVDLSWVKYRGVSPFQQPVILSVKAVNRLGVASLGCAYRYTLYLDCDRCLKPFQKQVTLNCTHTVVRRLANENSDDEEFLLAPDGFVELDELATNDVIPELPSRFLCREDCKGLCPICGCDLNETACGCSADRTDPRLQALGRFFESKGSN